MLRRPSGLWVPDYSKRRFCNMSGGLGSGLSELSLSSGTRGAVGSSFTPLSLSPALWIDPSDTATMFQTFTGTTAVTDGSVCGTQNDKSGASFNLAASANDGTRPTWNDNGGLPYLNYDGVDDKTFRAVDLGMYSAGACSVFLAIRGVNPATNLHFINSGRSSSNSPIYTPIFSNTVTGSSLSFFIRNDAAGGISDGSTVLKASAFDNSDRVVGVTDSGSTLTGYVDGVAGSGQSYTRSGAVTLDKFTVGAAGLIGFSNFFPARLYGLLIVLRVITAQEIANVTTYLGAKMGRTL